MSFRTDAAVLSLCMEKAVPMYREKDASPMHRESILPDMEPNYV